jgi:hypothetical protein
MFMLPERLSSSCCRIARRLLAAGALDHPNHDRRRRVRATGALVVFLSSSCCRSACRLLATTAQHCYEEIARPTQLVETLSSKSCWASLQSAGRRDFDCSIDDVCRWPRRKFVLTCAVLFGRYSTCSGINSTECYRIFI